MVFSTQMTVPSAKTRAFLLLTASCAALGVSLELCNAWPHPSWVPTGAGYSTSFPAGWAAMLNRLAFFTVQSNLIVAAVCTWAALAARHTRLLRFAYLVALVDITLTGSVYILVLMGPNIGVPFPSEVIVASTIEHLVVPLLMWVTAFLLAPLPWSRTVFAIALAHPALYCAFTLWRGAVVDWYPYSFLDLPGLGLPTVAFNVAVLSLVLPFITALALWVGRLGGRRIEADA